MKKALLVAALLTVTAFPAFANEYEGLTLHGYGASQALGLGTIHTANVTSLDYSNITTFTGQVFANGGATNQAGNTITKLAADDCNFTGADAGQSVSIFVFSVANLNAVSVSARPRVRFYQDNAGAPGTLLAGFSFNPITFTANNIGLFSASLPAGSLIMPSGTVWCGITFDNNTGGTGATAAQLNNLGQGMFNPPTVGSSADKFFISTAAGSNLVNSPAGSISNFGGAPAANFAWEFQADVTVPTKTTTWGHVKSIYR